MLIEITRGGDAVSNAFFIQHEEELQGIRAVSANA
jgi:hypothetical protein